MYVLSGKSTLLNYLARRDVAIVSDIAGTTRDVVEVSLDLGGVKCVVSDTAGLREQTSDQIEIEGMKRAKAIAEQAHFKICVVDASDTECGIRAVQNIIDEEVKSFRTVMLQLHFSFIHFEINFFKGIRKAFHVIRKHSICCE